MLKNGENKQLYKLNKYQINLNKCYNVIKYKFTVKLERM